MPSSKEWHEAENRHASVLIGVSRRYEIEDALVMELSHERARGYFPMASPAIVGEFARLRPGDERAVLRFAHRWGLLGYEQLSTAPLGGDPLVWVWAHAHGVRTALALHKLIRAEDKDALGARIQECALSQRAIEPFGQVNSMLADRERVGESSRLVTDLFAAPEKHDEYWSPVVLGDEPFRPAIICGRRERVDISVYPGTAHEDTNRSALRWILDIVNANLAGVYQQLTDTAPTEKLARERPGLPNLVWGFDALIFVIYRHLAEIVAGVRLTLCENCGLPFVQTDARQRFCPPAEWEKESRCGMAYRKRVRRRKERRK